MTHGAPGSRHGTSLCRGLGFCQMQRPARRCNGSLRVLERIPSLRCFTVEKLEMRLAHSGSACPVPRLHGPGKAQAGCQIGEQCPDSRITERIGGIRGVGFHVCTLNFFERNCRFQPSLKATVVEHNSGASPHRTALSWKLITALTNYTTPPSRCRCSRLDLGRRMLAHGVSELATSPEAQRSHCNQPLDGDECASTCCNGHGSGEPAPGVGFGVTDLITLHRLCSD